MPTEQTSKPQPGSGTAEEAGGAVEKPGSGKRPLSEAAQRALAEAAARRAKRDNKSAKQPPEVNGPAGPEPTRYGDWEIKGLTSDF